MRELLLFQSLYLAKTASEILSLVKSQPRPFVFYKSFLELDGTNMASILSFDSRCMSALLSDEHKEFFSSEFPIFYKNKISKSNNSAKFFYRSAIDTALKNNQVRAIQTMVEYVVKYQDNFVSSFLFNKNLTTLMEKGVEIAPLLNSHIFCYKYDCDEWPSTHTDSTMCMRPYNDSIFDLRKKYNSIFSDDNLRVDDKDEDELLMTSARLFKISYKVNMLPSLSEHIVFDPVT